MDTITTISNDRMAEFCNTIVMQTREALYEREEDILRAWHENISEAHENEDKFPPLKLSIAATVDLEAGKIETTVSFTTRYKTTISGTLPDPNQPELPGVAKAVKKFQSTLKESGASVTIGFSDKEVEITKDSIKATSKQ